MEEKHVLIIMIALFIVSFIFLFSIIGIPIMLNPNRGQSATLYQDNLNELNKYIDEFLLTKANDIEKEINNLNIKISNNDNLGESAFNDTMKELNESIQKYNEAQGLYYENEERIDVLEKLIDKLEREIDHLESQISSLQSSISSEKQKEEPNKSRINSLKKRIANHRENINKRIKEIKEFEYRIKESKSLLIQLNNDLSNFKTIVENNGKEYLKLLSDDGGYNYYEHKIAGFKNGFNKEKFINEIKKQLDIIFLMEINSLARPDTKVKDENVSVKYSNNNLIINSKPLIKEAINAYIDKITYNEFIVNENEDLLSYDRAIIVFERFADNLATRPIYKDYVLSPIPYFYVNKIHNYYIINDYTKILNKLLNIENGYFKKIIEAKGMKKNDVIEYFKNNMEENWLLSLGLENYYDEKHFANIEEEVNKKNPEGQIEILSRADYFMKSFNRSFLTYFPDQKLVGNFLSDFTNNARIGISDYLYPVNKESINLIYSQIPNNYMLISDGEDKIWEQTNKIRENLILSEIKSEKKEINKIGNIVSGNKSIGIGDLGFMQHIIDDPNLTFKKLYSNSIPVYSRYELKPGDLAFYHNPEIKEEGHIFGVYAGNNEFYHFNSYILYEDNNKTFKDVKIVKKPGNFNIFMRYYPINRGENND